MRIPKETIESAQLDFRALDFDASLPAAAQNLMAVSYRSILAQQLTRNN
jgi:hypothetical protein